jgi:hypothetical protein
MINKLALFITHNIFLTNDQIEELFNNNYIKTIGVSVPVWINAKNAKTTEPALEFFCEYEIINDKNEKEDVQIIEKKGYKIFMPNSNWKSPKPNNIQELCDMSQEERVAYEKKRDKWWKEHPEPMNIDNLKKSNYFRMQIKKLDQDFNKLKNCIVDVQHAIEIKTIDSLMKSLT